MKKTTTMTKRSSKVHTLCLLFLLWGELVLTTSATTTHTLECDTSGSGGSEGVCSDVITNKLAITSGQPGRVDDGDILDCAKGKFSEVILRLLN